MIEKLAKIHFPLFFFLFPFVSGVALAVTIDTDIPGVSGAKDPGAIVGGFYTFALMIGGVLAFGAIVYGGVKYVFAAGNPGQQNEGKEWVKGALLGLILLVGAYVLLKTINPNLVGLKLPTLTNIPASTSGGSTLIRACVADNGIYACSPGNKSDCSDVPACAGKTCINVDVSKCGQSATPTTGGTGGTF